MIAFVRSNRDAGAVWCVLVLSTLVSWWLGADHGFGHDGLRLATCIVIGVAFVKVALVARYFMDLQHAPVVLNLVFNAWVVGVCALCMTLYLRA